MDEFIIINTDFMPPKSEVLCTLADTAHRRGNEVLCLRMIDNFPWSFDSRMQSSTAYDESVLDFLSGQCSKLGIQLAFIFPGVSDFSRILRLNGYHNFFKTGEDGIIELDTDFVASSSLISEVIEDFNTLCQNTKFFINNDEADIQIFKLAIFEVTNLEVLPDNNTVLTAGRYLLGDESESDNSLDLLVQETQQYAAASYFFKQFFVSSSLGGSIPSACFTSIRSLYSDLIQKKKKLEKMLDLFLKKSSSVIEANWLDNYTEAVKFKSEEELHNIRRELFRFGFLKQD
ncbi:MAG: hypothetical protein PQJ46_14775 [Spirochaetales bacterium]|nr:hypothetical protein [Spirochaetales bacterium]